MGLGKIRQWVHAISENVNLEARNNDLFGALLFVTKIVRNAPPRDKLFGEQIGAVADAALMKELKTRANGPKPPAEDTAKAES